ncbi:nicotinate-nucleotide pyrophosphorylase [carboxylating] [Aestuariispira insulae]|uniref:Probable nicotinate-nucleotide pyrophosphorylase [carboxylating] n=2 Tax=Aestuariispira insulae TaxID=1461337 RepID=A0A3D9HW77_9PROT|nr:carboxylating nicotinate-nucleotide diphosphorylase [Aestuariispira insulae]RED53669.1 nicotinate-nucleotide pyrophosphorylase [carboxylating] [Aestuariispira insulae]
MYEMNEILARDLIERAYREDLGDAGDITTLATIPADAVVTARLNARAEGVACGVALAADCFAFVDRGLDIALFKKDGDRIAPKDCLMEIRGSARSILTAERVALNFSGRLSGIATLTADYVAQVAHTTAKICCTRKTTPGLRALEKFAVKCGGGMNHRFGLYDAVMIKDNHIAACGGIGAAIDRAREQIGHMVKIEVEIDRLADLEEALAHHPDIIMLDNMGNDDLREGIAIIAGRAKVEASGSVSLDRVASIAETGVDLISVGRLTHSAPNFDLGLDF